MSLDKCIALTKNSFDEYVASHDSIVIFHKKLCPHCKIMGTVLQKTQAKIAGLHLAAVDSEDEEDLKQRLGAERVPTLLVYKQGQLRAKFTGIMNPAETIKFYQHA